MSFLTNMAVSLIGSSGQTIPADMLMKIQEKNVKKGGAFSNVITQLKDKNAATLVAPTPPTPPANLSDPVAQATYNQALLTYNQEFQTYHTKMMALHAQRFNMMQQAILQAQRTHASSNNSSTSTAAASASSSGYTGGILDVE